MTVVDHDPPQQGTGHVPAQTDGHAQQAQKAPGQRPRRAGKGGAKNQRAGPHSRKRPCGRPRAGKGFRNHDRGCAGGNLVGRAADVFFKTEVAIRGICGQSWQGIRRQQGQKGIKGVPRAVQAGHENQMLIA